MQPPLFIYTALPCEAKPFIEHFRLKKELRVHAFAVFTRANICLTVTGIGKSAMAAGVAYSQALYASAAYPVLVNVGIAGHRDQPLGSLFLVNKCTDADTEKSHYPPLVFKPPCPLAGLITHAKPQLSYAHEQLCDMEASAFYETATRFSTAELIHALKVVSDNQHHPAGQVNAAAATALLAAQLAVMVEVLGQLEGLATPLNRADPPGFTDLQARYRFSVNEQQQLKAKLLRWQVVGQGDVGLPELKSGKEVLRWLDEKLSGVAFYL